VILKDICVLDVASCGRETTVLEAARLMRRRHTGTLIVVDDPQGERGPAGIVTDRDIVVQVLAAELPAATTPVASIMASPLVVGSATEPLDDALERLRAHGVRRLPVVEHDGSLLGIVTLDDLLRLHAAQGAALADIVTKERDHEQRARR
jgi:CBS domain-containing protein